MSKNSSEDKQVFRFEDKIFYADSDRIYEGIITGIMVPQFGESKIMVSFGGDSAKPICESKMFHTEPEAIKALLEMLVLEKVSSENDTAALVSQIGSLRDRLRGIGMEECRLSLDVDRSALEDINATSGSITNAYNVLRTNVLRRFIKYVKMSNLDDKFYELVTFEIEGSRLKIVAVMISGQGTLLERYYEDVFWVYIKEFNDTDQAYDEFKKKNEDKSNETQ